MAQRAGRFAVNLSPDGAPATLAGVGQYLSARLRIVIVAVSSPAKSLRRRCLEQPGRRKLEDIRSVLDRCGRGATNLELDSRPAHITLRNEKARRAMCRILRAHRRPRHKGGRQSDRADANCYSHGSFCAARESPAPRTANRILAEAHERGVTSNEDQESGCEIRQYHAYSPPVRSEAALSNPWRFATEVAAIFLNCSSDVCRCSLFSTVRAIAGP